MVRLARLLFAALLLMAASCGSQTSNQSPDQTSTVDVYETFEGGVNGAPVSVAALGAGLVCNKAGGSWSLYGNAVQQMQFSTAAERPLPASVVTACGRTTSPLGSMLGVAYNLNVNNSTAGSTGLAQYFWNATSNNVSVGVWFMTDLPASSTDFLDFSSMLFITNADGSDFASLMIHAGNFYLETKGNPNNAPDVGSFFAYTPNKWYWVTEQFQAYVNSTSMHSLAIYDCGTPQLPILPCTQLSLQKKLTVSGASAKPLYFSVGKTGDAGSPPNYVYYDELLADTTGQTFPTLP